MPNIHAELVHLPGYKPPRVKLGTKLGRTRAGKKVKNAYYNATSAKAKDVHTKETIGAKEPRSEADQGIRSALRQNVGMIGLGTGLGAGTATGTIIGAKKYPDSRKYRKTVNADINKARYVRITSLGTAAAKNPERWPKLPKKSFVVGAATGAGLGVPMGLAERKERQGYVQRAQKRHAQLATLNKAYEKVKPTYDAKAARKAGGLGFTSDDARVRYKARAKQNYKFTGPHGKENVKIQSRSTAGGALLGAGAGVAGAHHLFGPNSRTVQGAKEAGHSAEAIAGALRKPKAQMIGGAALLGTAYGSVTGQIRRNYRAGTRAANTSVASGDLRTKKKGEHFDLTGTIRKSAFGVEHG